MHKTILFYFLFFTFYNSDAQVSSPQVFASGGNVFTSQSFTNSYTIGEISLITTITAPTFLLTQGFHQPFEYMTNVEQATFTSDIILFPNPANDFIYLKLNNNFKGTLQIFIYNSLGSITHELNNISFDSGFNNTISFPIQHIATGTYMLKASLSLHENAPPIQTVHKIFVKTK